MANGKRSAAVEGNLAVSQAFSHLSEPTVLDIGYVDVRRNRNLCALLGTHECLTWQPIISPEIPVPNLAPGRRNPWLQEPDIPCSLAPSFTSGPLDSYWKVSSTEKVQKECRKVKRKPLFFAFKLRLFRFFVARSRSFPSVQPSIHQAPRMHLPKLEVQDQQTWVPLLQLTWLFHIVAGMNMLGMYTCLFASLQLLTVES